MRLQPGNALCRQSVAEPQTFAELRQFYLGKRVLVTGHTGFKGSWLSLWLSRLGANVFGLALAPDQGEHNLFDQAKVASTVTHAEADLRDAVAVAKRIESVAPQLVFHLGARALVKQGYDDPLATFATNTLGTANVLEATRRVSSIGAIVCVTTDKVYRERRQARPYRETDELGGLDPYSASKAAAELVARSYAYALLPADRRASLATARGGNVLGGGDWSQHRIVPDIVRSIQAGETLRLRMPRAIRPWQHVLDLCHAYLLLGRALFERTPSLQPADDGFDQAWNFGPAKDSEITVAELVDRFVRRWGAANYPVQFVELPEHDAQHESLTLSLDSARANEHLGWRSLLNAAETIDWTVEWYRAYLTDTTSARSLVEAQIARFENTLTERPQATLETVGS